MIHRLGITCGALLLTSPGLLLADTVYLKNGAWIDGIVRTRSSEVIQVDIGKIGKIEIPLEEVYEIEKNSRTGSETVLSVEGRRLEVEVDRAKKAEKGDSKGAGEEPGDQDSGEVEDDAGKKDAPSDSESSDAEDDLDEDDVDSELKARIEKLVEDLKRKKSKFRVRAQRHLKAIGPPAIPFLLPLTNDGSDLVRIAVFRLFHSIGDDRVIEKCIDALVDSNEYVRDYAHRALRRVSGESFGYKPFASPRRREEACQKWRKWWEEEQLLLEELEEQSR